MIVRDSRFGMGVGRCSRLQRGVRVLAMPDARLDTKRHLEFVCKVPPGARMPRLLVPGMVVGEIIDRRCVADGVTVTNLVIFATPELFSKDEGLEF
jgi:hypothetical protein